MTQIRQLKSYLCYHVSMVVFGRLSLLVCTGHKKYEVVYMAKVNIDKLENTGAQKEKHPLLNVQKEKGDFVYGVIKDLWTFKDRKFGGKRVGLTVEIFDGNGEVWDEENKLNIRRNNITGTYTLIFSHSYPVKTFEQKTPSEIIDEPVIIYNMGKGDKGYLYRIIIGDNVANYIE